MKKSNYIISTEIDNCVLYYNLVHDTLLSLPATMNEECVACLENPNDRDSIYWQKLYKDKFIIEDDYDELIEMQRRHWRTVSQSDEYNLTVICTLKCNSDCTYCYQRNLDFKYIEMTQTDLIGLYEFLLSIPKKMININWCGGEPMLMRKQILKFCKMLDSDKNHFYSHSISTNASIFDERFFEDMENYGLFNVNASVIGTGAIHSELRRSDEYDADIVFRNLIRIARYTTVVVDINLCKSNIDHVKEIFEYFDGYQYLPIRFRFTRIVSYDHNPCNNIELDVDTYMKHVIELSNWALDQGFHLCDMSCFQNFGVYCGAYEVHHNVIGPGLYVYQCNRTYNPDKATAQIVEGKLVHNPKLSGCEGLKSGIDPYAVEACKNCKILPYCNGGCNHMRKIGKSACPDEKNYLEDYLKLYYRIFYTQQQ